MNSMNFDPDSESSYPLTIDRMAELQEDLQAGMKALAGLLAGSDAIIIAGCGSAGAAGWACVTNESGQREVMEVKAGSGTPTHLVLTTETVTAANGEGTTVTVRTKRHLVWATEASGTSYAWSGMKRLRAEATAQDEGSAVTLTSGTDRWEAAAEGGYMKLQLTGGRVHAVCNMRVKLVSSAGSDSGSEVGYVENTDIVFPARYRPAGDTLVALRYNGAATAGVLTAGGTLLTGRTATAGDTLEMDTYIRL